MVINPIHLNFRGVATNLAKAHIASARDVMDMPFKEMLIWNLQTAWNDQLEADALREAHEEAKRRR